MDQYGLKNEWCSFRDIDNEEEIETENKVIDKEADGCEDDVEWVTEWERLGQVGREDVEKEFAQGADGLHDFVLCVLRFKVLQRLFAYHWILEYEPQWQEKSWWSYQNDSKDVK